MSSNTTNISNVRVSDLLSLAIPLPPLDEQQYIADTLAAQMAAVERARAASAQQRGVLDEFVQSSIRESLTESAPVRISLADALTETSRGVGASWAEHTLLGATRAGIAPAKEGVGKSPERYKRVDAATVFYNPMRILLGSIALVDEGEEGGITSPDYVVFKTKAGLLHHRWFYYWLRSPYGEQLITSLTRGAVRERILFRRLVSASIEVPQWEDQVRCSERLRAVPPLRRKITEQQRLIETLPETLLQEAFSGALSARRPPVPAPETVEDKQERMAAIIALLLGECRQHGRVLGRTVASKGLYLATAHAGVPLGVPFRRWQYGPYFNGIREVETYAEERGWFTNHSRQWGIEYVPGGAFADALAFAPRFLHGRASAMHEIAALLAGLNADGAEAVGTLYAAWNDFLLDDVRPDDATIIREVRENWHAEKAKIPVQTWEYWLAWMRAHVLTPRGTEPHTVPGMEGQHG